MKDMKIRKCKIK